MTYLLLFILVSGMLHISGAYLKVSSLKYIFKPLTTLLVILLAFEQGSSISPVYKMLILAGLSFSLVGDVFLMLPKDRFVAGLVSFLALSI